MKLDFSLLPTVVGIVGSREFPHLKWIENAVSRLPMDSIVVSGGARGVDQEAVKAAKKHKLRFKEFPIEGWEWNVLGKRIAYVRNLILVTYVHSFGGHVLIFANDDNGVLTTGSQMAWDICKELQCDHTVINDKGHVLWTTHASFAGKT